MLALADLMTPETPAAIRARMAAALAADAFPVSSWAPSNVGGVENLRLDMSSGIGILLPPRIRDIVTGLILPLSEGDFLKRLGKKFYGLDQRGATSTIENMALFLKPGASVNYTFAPAQLWVRSDATGNRYQLIGSGKFSPANASLATALMLQFQAENPGSSYSDAQGTILTMVTAKAGVQCINVAPSDYMPSPASVNGSSTGTLVVTIVPPAVFVPSSVRVRITASGNVGTAAFEASIDGGVTWGIFGPVATSLRIGSALLTFANSAVSPSFVVGDIFTAFSGSPIIQQGADAETETAFRRRCSNRWPALSPIPVAATIDLWSHLASDEVDRVSSQANPNTPGGILVTIASSVGPASPQAQIAVEDYIGPRLLGYQGVPSPGGVLLSPAETVIVASATAFNVLAAGPVRVPKAILATAQVAADVAWIAYLADLPLGGQSGSVVELAKLGEILADAGAIDVPSVLANLTVNGVSGDAVIPAGSVAVPTGSLLTSIAWIPA